VCTQQRDCTFPAPHPHPITEKHRNSIAELQLEVDRSLYGQKGESRKDVAAKLTKAMADRDGGIAYDAGKLTVEEHLERWLSDSVRDTVRRGTYERYESIVRMHLIPAIGRIKLKTLTPAHVRGLYRAKLDAGLAPRRVLHIHRTLSEALKQATDDGLIPRNAASLLKPHGPARRRYAPWIVSRYAPSSRPQARVGDAAASAMDAALG